MGGMKLECGDKLLFFAADVVSIGRDDTSRPALCTVEDEVIVGSV